MKTTNSIVAVALLIVLGVGPVLTFARLEGPRSSVLSSRRVRPIPKLRRTVPRSVQSPRLIEGQTSTMLPDGGLLMVGGMDQDGPKRSIEIFNSRTGKSKALPGMAQDRAHHSATMLPDGRVFVFGGVGKNQRVLNTGMIVDPDTGETEQVLAKSGLSSRAYHTATLLTDGRILIVGGRTDGDRQIDIGQLWDYRTLTATPVGTLSLSREKHTATLLTDGNVLIEGGINETGAETEAAELFNVEANTFSITTISSAESERGTPFLAASIPFDGAIGVAVDTKIAVRFSQRLSAEAIKEAIKFETPQEGVAIKVIPAENGRLVFINPLESLRKGTAYQVSIVGPTDGLLNITPASVSFTTVADNPPMNRGGADLDWTPDAESLRGDWQSKRGRSSSEDQPLLEANPGETALAGRVLTLTGHPLPDVTISVNGASTRTDGSGRFLLKATSGRYVMMIDGRTANRPGKTYGIFRAGVDITEGITNVLDYTIWMPKLDMAHAVTIPSPNSRDIVITNPAIPGLELHLPAGTVIRDIDGKAVKQVSITPVPTDRPPLPLPSGLKVPVFASIQPGGAQVIPPRARLIYPNYNNEVPGARINFWNYDPEGKGWYIYGQGTVTPNGKQIVPDPGVVIYEFSGIMISEGGSPPLLWPEPGDDDEDGDPVDLSTGLFVLQKTDLVLPDTIPISLTRTYRPGDTTSRPFGIGSSHPYEMFLWSNNNYQEADLILPDGGRIHYVRTSPGTSFTDAVYEHTSSPSAFYKSRLRWNGNAWDLSLVDGTVFLFPDMAPLASIRDRYGNELLITRQANVPHNITQLTSPNGRWIQFTYGSGNRISQARDNSGRTVNYTYDSSGRLWKVTDPNGGVTEYIYDSSHRMLTIEDARGITYLTNEYDSGGRVIKQTQADDSTYEFDYTLNGSGKITQTDVTGPRGNVRRLTFNSSGYTLTDTRAFGTSLARTVTYTRQSGTNRVLTATDPLSRQTAYTYNSHGKILTVTELAGTQSATTTTFTYEPDFQQLASVTDALNHTTLYAYDNHGNLISVTNPLSHQTTFGYNSSGQITSVTDPLNKTTHWTYDSGDVASMTNPLGDTFTRTVDALGRPILITDPLGRTTTVEYDSLNQPTQITDARGGITSFSYDENGNLLAITDPNTNATNYSYDSMDRLETRTDPLLRSESSEYDEDGNLTKFTDRRAKVTTFTYDALGRQDFAGFGKVVTGGSTTYESTITYTYDAASRLEEVVDSASGTMTLDYDDMDRLTGETTPQGTVSYTYDDAGRQTSMTVTGRAAVNYTYDNADRLTGITQGGSSVTYLYDAANRRTSLTLPNGLVTEYGYDDGSNLTSITYKQGSTVLGDLTYEYDAARNRTKMGGSYARTGLPQAFASATYNAANQMTQRASTALSYDNNGNLTVDGANTYSWDARNQLTAISGGISASFEYDSFGRRISKTLTSQTTTYLYDGVDIVQELSGGSPTADMLNGATSDERLTCNCNGASRTLLSDALSSTLALTSSSGAVQTEYTYEPFGATTTSGTTSSNALQYTGRENDSTGLHYYRARYYSPVLQRFISEDPAEFHGGDTNLYAYVGNSPANFTDPSGEIPAPVGACVGGAAFNVGFDLLSGRKPTWQSALSGCVGGLLGFGLFRGLPLLRGLKPKFSGRLGRGVRPKNATPKSCFTAGTEIATAEGKKPIEAIEIGDLVWAYDENTGETALRRVARLFSRSTNLIVVVTVGDEVIETTLDHPFWVEDKGWVEGKDLRVGDALRTLRGVALSITSIEYVPGNVAVYNFEVEGFHTYFVSSLQVLVHNKAMRRKPGKRGERKGTDALRRENKVVRDVVKELGLDKDQQRRLHDELQGEDLTFHEILELARTMFNK